MSQFNTLQLKNQAGVEQSFTVSGIDYSTNVATWLLAGASYDDSVKATFSLAQPTARSSRARVKLRLSIPIMDTVIPTRKVDEILASVELVLPKSSTLGARQDLRAYITDFLADTVVVKAVENYESVY